jgi:hypothetical protein
MLNNHNVSLSLLMVGQLMLCLLLTGCAKRIIPEDNLPPVPEVVSADTEHPQPSAASRKIAVLETLLACMESMDSHESKNSIDMDKPPSSKSAAVNRLQPRSTSPASVSEKVDAASWLARFTQACLLSRETASEQEWDQAQAILAELTLQYEEQEERLLLRYLERMLAQHRTLRLHQTRLNRLRQLNLELQNKIEQLKGLERDLDVNNPYSAEPHL